MSETTSNLVEPRETTSVWSQRWDASSQLHVDTLLRQQGAVPASLNFVKDAHTKAASEWLPTSFVTTVQFVRHGSNTRVFVNDVIADIDESDAESKRIELHSHSGAVVDRTSLESLFSPLAITFMLEDGTARPSAGNVQFMQRTRSHDSIVGEARVVDAQPLPCFELSDALAPCVMTPYPMSTSAPPSVSIIDLSSVYRFQMRRLDTAFFAAIAVARAVFQTPPNVALNTWLTTTIGLSSVSALFTLFGPAVVASATLRALPLIVPGNDGNSTASTKDVVTALLGLANEKSKPEPTRVRLTIPAFTRALRTLSTTKSLTDEQLKEIIKSSKSFRTELLVWRWLQEQERAETPNVFSSSTPSGEDQDASTKWRGAFRSNPLVTTELAIPEVANTTVDTFTRVTLDDACGAPSVYDIDVPRAYAALASAAAAQLLRNLEELQDAIASFELAIDDAIQNSTQLWMPYTLRRASLDFLKRNFRKFRNTPEDEAVADLQSRSTLKQVQGNISVKLANYFVKDGSVGQKLCQRLRTFVGERVLRQLAPADTGTLQIWMRELPHRVAPVTYLFPSALQDVVGGEVDIETDAVVVREQTALHDASVAASEAIRRTKKALPRVRVEFEKNGTQRIRLAQHFQLDRAPSQNVHYSVDTFSLLSRSTSIPLDLVQQRVRARMDESTQRRVNLICSSSWSSALTLSGFEHSRHGVLVAHLFGVLWAEELVLTHGRREKDDILLGIDDVMQSAKRRAAHRATAMAEFVLQTAPETPAVGFFVSSDAAFVATQRGRDARLALDITGLNVASDVLNDDAVSALRAFALSVRRGASGFLRATAGRSAVLPFEPLQSLFGARFDALHAFTRTKMACDAVFGEVGAGDALADKAHALALASVAASYASSQLLANDEIGDGVQQILKRGAGSARPYTGDAVESDEFDIAARRAVQTRMSVLRLDFDPVQGVRKTTVAELTELMACTPMLDDATRSYFVPFGYGQQPAQPLRNDPTAAMFGSVPVDVQRLAAAIRIVCAGTGVDASVDSMTWILKPSFSSCVFIPVPSPVLDATPELIVHTTESSSEQPQHVLHYVGSAPNAPLTSEVQVAQAADNCHDAANLFRTHSDATRLVGSFVGSVVWNAERICQALALVACEKTPIALLVDPHPSFQSRTHLPAQKFESSTFKLRLLASAHFTSLRKLIKGILKSAQEAADVFAGDALWDELFDRGIIFGEHVEPPIGMGAVPTGALPVFADDARKEGADWLLSTPSIAGKDAFDWAKQVIVESRDELLLGNLVEGTWPNVPLVDDSVLSAKRRYTKEQRSGWQQDFLTSTESQPLRDELQRAREDMRVEYKTLIADAADNTESRASQEVGLLTTQKHIKSDALCVAVCSTVLAVAMSSAVLPRALLPVSIRVKQGESGDAEDDDDVVRAVCARLEGVSGAVDALSTHGSTDMRLAEAALIMGLFARVE